MTETNNSILQSETVPELSSTYHKAQKNYSLFSALLLAWELIGIEIPETPLENVKIVLKSPQAIPYVLVVLILYFALRYWIEWRQCDARRRVTFPSRIDFWLSHSIAVVALGVYTFQSIKQVQVAEYFGQSLGSGSMLLAFAFIQTLVVADFLKKVEGKKSSVWGTFVKLETIVLLLCIVGMLIQSVLLVRGEFPLPSWMFLMLIIPYPAGWFLYKIHQRSRLAKTVESERFIL